MDADYKLTLALKRLNVSRAEFAQALGVSIETVDNWCVRRVRPRPQTLHGICEALRRFGASADMVDRYLTQELASQGLLLDRWVRSTRGAGPESQRGPVYVILWNGGPNGMLWRLGRLCRDALERVGYRALLLDCCELHQLKATYLTEAIASRSLGVISILQGSQPSPEADLWDWCTGLASADIPLVLLHSGAHPPMNISGTAQVDWDTTALIEAGVRTLLDAGHTEIGAILHGSHVQVRHDEFKHVMAEHEVSVEPRRLAWVSDDDTAPSEADPTVGEVVLNSTAVLVSAGSIPKLYRMCRELGVRVPKDLSVVSLGMPGYSPEWIGPLTYVQPPFLQVARAGTRLLLQLMEGDPAANQATVTYGASHMAVVSLGNGSVARPRQSRTGGATASIGSPLSS